MPRPYLYGQPVNRIIFRISPDQEAYLRTYGDMSNKMRDLIEKDMKLHAQKHIHDFGFTQYELSIIWKYWDQEYSWLMKASKQDILEWIERVE